MARTGKLIVCKGINLDKEYRNVLSYNETQMLNLVTAKQVAVRNNCSFIRDSKNEINVDISYSTLIECNYMAFQNPSYANKWFFAFIDSIEYVSNGTCNIKFTVDLFSTWYDYWDAKQVFVLREHVSDDTVGLHTINENLEHGDYIIQSCDNVGANLDLHYIVIETTYIPDNFPGTWNVANYGGVFSGTFKLIFEDATNAGRYLKAMDTQAKKDAIVSMYMTPSNLCVGLSWHTGTLSGETITVGTIQNTTGAVIINDKNITMSLPLSFSSYTPQNNKCLVYPYQSLVITNNNGASAEFHYEDFINNLPTFSIAGVITNGCSVKMWPNNYLKFQDGVSDRAGFNYGIPMSKLPSCSWKNDLFTNWQTEQAVNFGYSYVKESVAGAISGNPLGILSNIGDYLVQKHNHSLIPPQASGTNTADVSFGMNKSRFTYYKLQVKEEYIRQIDDYFTKFGYQINRLKLPNQIGRTYFNYVKISNDDVIGNSTKAPQEAMDVINNIYRKGVTIWHSHDRIGNYSGNTIVTP